ncbi:MAG TPA: tRNA (uridine(34)/cytosine(34)/5-carboxymethylaminomethyluridine(34)-2'-O)-methyltransferase TrmL [Gammaproteobacteria bacterium]|nr:tRNA (uridine(34)/cytosine(34)/5-carboxymethylaminomethyluridine(34)-2'-O)-methyltransferase TrmL [Gammaproteobacteria bacterium]
MFNVVLFEPEIPPNTGNIIRLCANIGASLHLIKPLGFELDDKKLRRAGLDYREFVDIRLHNTYSAFLASVGASRIFACSTRGKKYYSEARFRDGDSFLFGPETRGLPAQLLNAMDQAHIIRLPMRPDSRSLNLSNAVSTILYEAWRQNDFKGVE